VLRPRVVSSPDGDRWKIKRRWLDRPVPRIRESIRAADDRSPVDRGLDLWAIPDVSDGLPAAIGIAIAAVVLIFVFLPLIGIVLELAILIVLLCSGIVGKVFLRRPWVIEVIDLDNPERSSLFAVGGWQQSQRAMGALAQRIPVSGVPQGAPEGTPLAL
jgi:hypothetical protein